MNKEQSIQSVLHKLSASSMKVEFRNIVELKNVTKLAGQLISKVDKVNGQWDTKLKSYGTARAALTDIIVMAQELYFNMQTLLKQANAEKSSFEKSVKELGVPASSVAEYGLVEKAISSAEESQSNLEKILTRAKNLW